ncbi:MAG: malonate decarboxylase holo-[acyl-carrier-protein] synthase [Proteobacteria bacterium]|nr:malonate decarboxylase holo-[acyl-carrier-protein] synthase [Pseudomonadota bacterium]
MTALRRHALVRLATAPDAETDDDRRRATDWQRAGRPFVVARRGDDSGAVRLGFCTVDPRHPQLRPRRVAVRALPADIVAIDHPPTLGEIVAAAATHPRHDTLARLHAAAHTAGIDVRVFGSWMWQALTGEPHVHALSDLDVLVDVSTPAEADRVAAFLATQETATGLTLDGELHLAGVGDLSWREWHGDAPEVLVKTLDTMRLVPRMTLRP